MTLAKGAGKVGIEWDICVFQASLALEDMSLDWGGEVHLQLIHRGRRLLLHLIVEGGGVRGKVLLTVLVVSGGILSILGVISEGFHALLRHKAGMLGCEAGR